jgi:hypothetical protein
MQRVEVRHAFQVVGIEHGLETNSPKDECTDMHHTVQNLDVQLFIVAKHPVSQDSCHTAVESHYKM